MLETQAVGQPAHATHRAATRFQSLGGRIHARLRSDRGVQQIVVAAGLGLIGVTVVLAIETPLTNLIVDAIAEIRTRLGIP